MATSSFIVLFSIAGVVIALYALYGAWELLLQRHESDLPLPRELAIFAIALGLGLLLIGVAQVLRMLLVLIAKA